jgi:hypothetical protein
MLIPFAEPCLHWHPVIVGRFSSASLRRLCYRVPPATTTTPATTPKLRFSYEVPAEPRSVDQPFAPVTRHMATVHGGSARYIGLRPIVLGAPQRLLQPGKKRTHLAYRLPLV